MVISSTSLGTPVLGPRHHDSGEIFVLCSTVAHAHRLSDYSVNVSGDCVIFKTVHHLNLIESPYDLNYLNKTKPIR